MTDRANTNVETEELSEQELRQRRKDHPDFGDDGGGS